MSLKHLSNSSLIEHLKSLVADDRKLNVQILHHLKELENRKLHLEMGFSSLFDYCVTCLKYSESQAQRRITAMRLIQDVPEVENKIKEGTLSLTNASKIQSFISQSKKDNKPLSLQEKKDLIQKVENKSTRECERELLKLSPEPVILKEKERVLSEEYIEIKVTVKKELKDKLNKVKSLLSHKNPNPTYQELLDLMCDLVIQVKEPKQKSLREKQSSKNSSPEKQLHADSSQKNPSYEKPVQKQRTASTAPQVNCDLTPKFRAEAAQDTDLKSEFKSKKISRTDSLQTQKVQVSKLNSQLVFKNSVQKISRYIPNTIKHAVYMRDQGCCSYKNHQTGRRCSSRHLLQYDHVQPLAFNSTTTVKNLRLLCFNHHKLVTEKIFSRK